MTAFQAADTRSRRGYPARLGMTPLFELRHSANPSKTVIPNEVRDLSLLRIIDRRKMSSTVNHYDGWYKAAHEEDRIAPRTGSVLI